MTMLPNIDEAMEDARNGKLSPYWQNNLKRECLHFDNQFMFVMFHYGIFPVIAWLCVYASTLKGSKIYNEQSRIVIRAAKFVGFFVLLAYMGVSTYYQIELGYSGVIVMMLIGKALREKYYGRS